ncbi:MAG TPA: hypothetical protein VGI76_08625 [Solirubrobacteraceae bacterium]|jgi:hypothetical protein
MIRQRTLHRRGRTFAPAAVAAMLLAGCGPMPAGEDPAASWPAAASRQGCVEHDGLPDARCTPGAIRAGVTLATLCAYGYSRRVRPPESYTEPLKLAQIRAYHLPGRVRDYEEDHPTFSTRWQPAGRRFTVLPAASASCGSIRRAHRRGAVSVFNLAWCEHASRVLGCCIAAARRVNYCR